MSQSNGRSFHAAVWTVENLTRQLNSFYSLVMLDLVVIRFLIGNIDVYEIGSCGQDPSLRTVLMLTHVTPW